MDEGRFVQVGEPADIYENPASRFIANFIGSANLLDVKIVDKRGNNIQLQHNTSSQRFAVVSEFSDESADNITLALRPEKILIDKEPLIQCDNQLTGTVREIAYLGKISTYRVETNIGETLEVTAPNQSRSQSAGHRIEWNDPVHLGWSADSAFLLSE